MTLLLDDEVCELMSPPCKAPCTETAGSSAPVFHRKGGNGLEKMEALAFGSPLVRTVDGDRVAAKRARASPAFDSAHTTRSADTPQMHTQPKAVSGATPTNAVTPVSDSPEVPSTAPHHAAREGSTPQARTSLTAPHNTVSRALNLEETAEASATTKPVVAAAAAKQQMKLSDFFSKMACKRTASS